MSSEQKKENLVRELQVLEQNLQHLLIEKQSLEVDCNEINNALEELKITKEEVYRILGNIMLKSDKNILIKELEDKKKLSDLHLNSIENQEKLVQQKIDKLRKEITAEISKEKG